VEKQYKSFGNKDKELGILIGGDASTTPTKMPSSDKVPLSKDFPRLMEATTESDEMSNTLDESLLEAAAPFIIAKEGQAPANHRTSVMWSTQSILSEPIFTSFPVDERELNPGIFRI
jgi:hypothetical protein